MIVNYSQDKQGNRNSNSGFILFAVFLVRSPRNAAADSELLFFFVLGNCHQHGWSWVSVSRNCKSCAVKGEPISSPTKCWGGMCAWEGSLLHPFLYVAPPTGLGQGSAIPRDLSNLWPFPKDLTCHPLGGQRWVGLYCLRAWMEILCLTWLRCCYWSCMGYFTITLKLIASHGECHYDEIIRPSISNSSTESFLTGASSEACWMCPLVSGHL